MFNNNNGYSLADIAAATGNGNNSGFGGFNGDGGWIILLLIIIFIGGWGGNGWGNNSGAGNGGGSAAYITSDVQRGFDQAAITTGINNISAGLCNGFAGVQQSLCNGFAQAEIGANTRQMANMNQLFGVQQSISGLGYNIATEACADRQAVNDGVRDIMAADTANTQALFNAINGGIQSIRDQLCQDKIDAKNELIANLRQEIAMKDLAASQIAQNAFIQQGFATEVDQLYNRLNNCPVPTTPVYGKTPIFTCGGNSGCGCGNNTFYN